MRPLVFCTGMVRSGSTWSFNVCRLLGKMLAMQRREPFGSAYLVQEQLETFLNGQAAQAKGPTVIKTHIAGPTAMQFLQSGRARAICTHRDPRDCAVSMRSFMGGEIIPLARSIASGFELIKAYQSAGSTLFVRYEQLMADPIGQISQIADHLCVRVNQEALVKIDRQTNIESTLEICERLKERPASAVLYSGSHRVDPATSLHDNHIINSKPGRWRDELTVDEAYTLTNLFRPWLLDFGYETTESLAVLSNVWQAVASDSSSHNSTEVSSSGEPQYHDPATNAPPAHPALSRSLANN